MAAKLTRTTHEIAIQLHLVAESCIICISRSRRPVRKLLDIHPHIYLAHSWLSTMSSYVHNGLQSVRISYHTRLYSG